MANKNRKKIAFFAPIKPPDHPIPSGDRLIAGNLLKALGSAGFEAELASRYICYSKRSGPEILRERKQGALAEAERLVETYKAMPADRRPEIWITYHPYCKAPDWIGPVVTRALNIPYVTVEAAKTGQGQNDEWGPWREEAQAGIKQADRHLCFKPTDKEYLTGLLGSDEKIFDFPAFINLEEDKPEIVQPLPKAWAPDAPVMITTGMMRPGKKVRNFEIMAEVLNGIADGNWNMIVVGGGPEEENIRNMYNGINTARMLWTGQIEHDQVLQWMRGCDVFLWPGWKEPIGMVYLEAQLQGLPVIASNSMGVPLVVEHNETGLLSPEGDISAMQENIMKLLADRELREKMGKAARHKVKNGHSVEAAATRLVQVLADL